MLTLNWNPTIGVSIAAPQLLSQNVSKNLEVSLNRERGKSKSIINLENQQNRKIQNICTQIKQIKLRNSSEII